MKTRHAVVLAMLTGTAGGATAVEMLHAQSTPPVYMVAINEISNLDGYRAYQPSGARSIKDHGGVYIAAGPVTNLTGALPNGRGVILRWPSMEAMQAWRNSPEYRVGEQFAKYNIVALTGVQ